MLGDEIVKEVGGTWLDGLGTTMHFDQMECRPDRIGSADNCLFGVFEEYWRYNQWFSLETLEGLIGKNHPRGILTSRRVEGFQGGQLLVDDVPRAFGRLVRLFEGAPDESMEVIGVTGTNGKTSTTVLMTHILQTMGKKVGRMGTLGTWVDGKDWEPGEYTTDLAIDVYRKLRQMRENGVQSVAMEVSSHGLALGRVAGLQFTGAVVTNVTRDHLDFHETLEAYIEAKRSLVEGLSEEAVVAINVDDVVAQRFIEATKARVVRFGESGIADVCLREHRYDGHRTHFTIRWQGERFKGETGLVGQFQLMNLLGAIAVLVGRGYPMDAVMAGASSIRSVPGRMETVPLRSGAIGVIDYAHNPDGLEHLLNDVRALKPRRLILVFGCGGDRDVGKRPMMGALASSLADMVWITSDNPRTEDPLAIIAGIEQGLSGRAEVFIEADRRRAIEAACAQAESGDIVVVAGKGHEDYQIVGTEKHPFSDREELRRFGAV